MEREVWAHQVPAKVMTDELTKIHGTLGHETTFSRVDVGYFSRSFTRGVDEAMDEKVCI